MERRTIIQLLAAAATTLWSSHQLPATSLLEAGTAQDQPLPETLLLCGSRFEKRSRGKLVTGPETRRRRCQELDDRSALHILRLSPLLECQGRAGRTFIRRTLNQIQLIPDSFFVGLRTRAGGFTPAFDNAA